MSFIKSITVHALGEASGLALSAFRMMAAAADSSEIVDRFDAHFGVTGRAGLGAMHLLVREIGTAGARRLCVACPGCCRMTADELSVLALLSAAQARDHARVEAHLIWLLAGRTSETARSAALAIGGLFKSAGLTIENPGVEGSAPARAPGRAALHAAGNA
ncbi:MAG: hypothetical protein U5J99_03345 [Parvularculaceae bacterium]|nr:hypothetical protein [Parvularculaceae bacterium]